LIEQKLSTLAQIRRQYAIDQILYNRVKRAIRVGLKLDNEEKNKFLENLPSQLRIELSVLIHKDIVHGIEFFENKPPRFLAMIGPMLNFIKISEGELVVTEGDLAEQMFFIKEGEISIVLSKFNDFPFMTISSGYFFGEVIVIVFKGV
jgi:hypothetical protein